MTFPELDKAYRKVINDMKGGPGAEVMVKTAITAFSLIRQRVQETGVNAKGQKFKPYSTKPTLVGSSTFTVRKDAATKLLGSKPKRKELEWRTVGGMAGGGAGVRLAILPGGYKKIRELQGRQTDHVDFSMSGRMWANIMADKPKKSDLLSTDADHARGIAIIGAKEELNKKKLEGNTARRGNILDLSTKEIEELKKSYNLGVLNIFKENGL